MTALLFTDLILSCLKSNLELWGCSDLEANTLQKIWMTALGAKVWTIAIYELEHWTKEGLQSV